MSEPKFTEGPWRWELNEKSRRLELCGGKVRYDLIVMDFVRWGFGGAAPRFNVEVRTHLNVMERAETFGVVCPGRAHHADWFKLLRHPDAQLIEAAPDLYAVLRAFVDYYEGAGIGPCPEGQDDADDPDGFDAGERYLVRQARAALAKARGEVSDG